MLSIRCLGRELVGVFYALILATAIFFAGCFEDEGRNVGEVEEAFFAINLQKQNKRYRAWREIEVDTLAVIGRSGKGILYKPGYVKGDSSGVYVIDYGDSSVKKFDKNGDLIVKYGQGRGEGPGEFINPTGVAIGENGTVWVADGGARSLNWFTSDGDFLRKLTFKDGILRVAPIEGGWYYLMRVSPLKPEIFFLYNAEDAMMRSFGELVENYRDVALSLSGDILSVRKDMVYVSSYYGVILRFDVNGELAYAREGIEKGKPPQVETGQAKGNLFQRIVNKKTLYNCPSLSGEKLYVHAFSTSKELDASILDVYHVTDGTYQYSFKLPGFSICTSVAGDYIYTLQDTTAVVYRVREVD
jgi:hypothetical protein